VVLSTSLTTAATTRLHSARWFEIRWMLKVIRSNIFVSSVIFSKSQPCFTFIEFADTPKIWMTRIWHSLQRETSIL